MTRRPGWVEKKCREGNTEDLLPGTPVISQWLAHQHLEREHRRALRVVKKAAQNSRDYIMFETPEEYAAYRRACSDITTALQKGRT